MADKLTGNRPGRPSKREVKKIVNEDGTEILISPTEERRAEVYDYMTEGFTATKIHNMIGEKWNVARKTIENDITVLRKQMVDYYRRNREEVISDHLGKYDTLYKKCLEKRDYDTAVKVMAAKEKLMKMHTVEPVVTINNLSLNGYSTEQLAAIQSTLQESPRLTEGKNESE